MDIKTLMIDDDNEICEQVKQILNNQSIGGNKLLIEFVNDFEEGFKILEKNEYDLIILDLFRGKPVDVNIDRPGTDVLEKIKKHCFTPVIFFTGLSEPVKNLESNIVKIVRKGDGIDALKNEILNISESKILTLKNSLNKHVRETMRSYFWDFVHPNWEQLSKMKDDISLGYLLVRRFSNSLSKEKISAMLNDQKISSGNTHPMEFYVYPPFLDTYETGDILKMNGNIFVVLTPTCDLVLRSSKRKAENILLVMCIPMDKIKEYNDFKQSSSNNNKKELEKLIGNRKSDRYFFLPGTPFINNTILDFQRISVIKEEDLNNYSRVAKLDDPFAQSMLSSFIRYYNRIGHPPIDVNKIMENI